MTAFRPDQDQVTRWEIGAASEAQKVLHGPCKANVQLRLVNGGDGPVHIRSGKSDVAATTDDLTVLPGVTEVLTFQIPDNGDLYLAVIGGDGATGVFEATGGVGF